jgi:hypothetical protein
MAVPKIDPLEFEGSKGGRGGRETRAPAGFKKAIEEIAQIIFSKTKISVEGAAKSVVPSIPKMIQQISDDIRTGSIEKFKVSLNKLENIIDKLGLDLGKYNKNLANFIEQRQEKLIKSEEQISEIREQGAKAEINQITGEIQFLSREEIKQRRDTLKETLIEMKNVEKIKTKQEKQLQESRFLSEEEIKSKKQFVSESYETLKTLETNKQNLMKTLNIQSEEDLPSTGLFSGFNRKGNERQSGEGIREYIPSFLLDIADTFKSQITGFFQPLIMLKDIFLDILKPLKIFKKILTPLIAGMTKLVAIIGRQIATGLALVAVNILRILTDKKVLIGLLAIAGVMALKNLQDRFKDGPEGPKRGSAGDYMGEAADPNMMNTLPEDETRVKGTRGMLGLSSEPQTAMLKIEKGERVLNRAETNAYNRNEALGIDTRKENASLLGPKATTSNQANVGVSTNVSNVQTQNTSSVSNLSTGSVTNNGNAWFNQVGSF